MMKIKIEGLRTALKKVKGFCKESLVMEFMTRATGEGEERYLKFDASNGTAQASVLASYVGDNEEAKKFIVSSAIVDVVDSIAAFGEEVTVEPLDSCLKLRCGDAVVTVGFLKDATTLEMTNLKNVEKLQVRLKAEDFAYLVSHGGFASDPTASAPIFKGTVVLTPCVEKDKLLLRSMSCCRAFLAVASAEVETADSATFNKFAGKTEETQKSVAINHASLLALTKRLVSEYVTLVITDKQVIVGDGEDVYLFTVIEGQMSSTIIGFVVKKVKKGYEFTVDRDTFKKAIAVVSSTGECLFVRLTFEGEVLTIEDGKRTSRVAVPITAIKNDCKAEVALAVDCVKSIVSYMSSELTVYNPEGGTGVYFEGAGSKAYLLPVNK